MEAVCVVMASQDHGWKMRGEVACTWREDSWRKVGVGTQPYKRRNPAFDCPSMALVDCTVDRRLARLGMVRHPAPWCLGVSGVHRHHGRVARSAPVDGRRRTNRIALHLVAAQLVVDDQDMGDCSSPTAKSIVF